MNTKEIKQRIGQSIENLNILNNEYPLAELRNSNFIGCFESEADLSEKSEAIVKDIFSQKYVN